MCCGAAAPKKLTGDPLRVTLLSCTDGQQLLNRVTECIVKFAPGRGCLSKMLARSVINQDNVTFRLLDARGFSLTSAMLTTIVENGVPEDVRINYLQQLLAKDACRSGRAVLSPNRRGDTVLDLAIKKNL